MQVKETMVWHGVVDAGEKLDGLLVYFEGANGSFGISWFGCTKKRIKGISNKWKNDTFMNIKTEMRKSVCGKIRSCLIEAIESC